MSLYLSMGAHLCRLDCSHQPHACPGPDKHAVWITLLDAFGELASHFLDADPFIEVFHGLIPQCSAIHSDGPSKGPPRMVKCHGTPRGSVLGSNKSLLLCVRVEALRG